MHQLSLNMVKDRMDEMGLTFMSAGLETFLSEKERTNEILSTTIMNLLDLEYIPRKERMAKTRLKVSGIPQLKRVEEFDLSWIKGGLTQKKLNELESLAFIARKENVIFMGPSGLGKTHLMLALGHKACFNGYTAYYSTGMNIVEALMRAKGLSKLQRKLSWLKKPHVLLLDEVGYENLNPEQATLFFQLINARYEYGSIICTTNKPFSKWGEVMSDDAIATATLDRLLHHSHVISLSGDSYRMKDRIKTGIVDPS